jgi:putative membrane protein
VNDARLESDPRVYFAAERTLLAWIRTGLTLMGFGFVVARFGLFLAMLRQTEPGNHVFSMVVGVSLVLLGVVTVAMSTIQHSRFIATLASAQLPQRVAIRVPILLAWTLCVTGLMLAGYLSL